MKTFVDGLGIVELADTDLALASLFDWVNPTSAYEAKVLQSQVERLLKFNLIVHVGNGKFLRNV